MKRICSLKNRKKMKRKRLLRMARRMKIKKLLIRTLYRLIKLRTVNSITIRQKKKSMKDKRYKVMKRSNKWLEQLWKS